MTLLASDLQPGTVLRHKHGEIVVLDRRKKPDEHNYDLPFHPGWWLLDDAGGLADFVIDDPEGDWTLA